MYGKIFIVKEEPNPVTMSVARYNTMSYSTRLLQQLCMSDNLHIG